MKRLKSNSLTNKHKLNVLNSLRGIKPTQYNCLEHFLCDSPERRFAFNLLLNDIDLMYKLAYRNKLLKYELQIVYSKYSHDLFNLFKKNFRSYYRYCTTFKDFLSEDEKKLLIKYLEKNKYWHFIKFSLIDFKFNKKQKDNLTKYIIMNKLILIVIWINAILYLYIYQNDILCNLICLSCSNTI